MCTTKTAKIDQLHATTDTVMIVILYTQARLHVTEFICHTARNQNYFHRDSQQ